MTNLIKYWQLLRNFLSIEFSKQIKIDYFSCNLVNFVIFSNIIYMSRVY